jgi:hypothetical protein
MQRPLLALAELTDATEHGERVPGGAPAGEVGNTQLNTNRTNYDAVVEEIRGTDASARRRALGDHKRSQP